MYIYTFFLFGKKKPFSNDELFLKKKKHTQNLTFRFFYINFNCSNNTHIYIVLLSFSPFVLHPIDERYLTGGHDRQNYTYVCITNTYKCETHSSSILKKNIMLDKILLINNKSSYSVFELEHFYHDLDIHPYSR